jgi:non-ribosomal peptide synthetase component E (peptide arylation enzyme)
VSGGLRFDNPIFGWTNFLTFALAGFYSSGDRLSQSSQGAIPVAECGF